MNCSNEAAYVEPPVDKALSFDTTLYILNIKLYNRHVRLWGDFDYPWFGGQNDVIEDMIALHDFFYIIRGQEVLDVAFNFLKV